MLGFGQACLARSPKAGSKPATPTLLRQSAWKTYIIAEGSSAMCGLLARVLGMHVLRLPQHRSSSWVPKVGVSELDLANSPRLWHTCFTPAVCPVLRAAADQLRAPSAMMVAFLATDLRMPLCRISSVACGGEGLAEVRSRKILLSNNGNSRKQ